MQLRKHFYQATRLVAGLLVVVLAMTGAAKLADQIVTWLAFAVWQPFTIADALRFWDLPPPLAPESLGLRRITDAVLSWPGVRRIFCSPAPASSCLHGSIARSASARASPLTHLRRAGLARSPELPLPREQLKPRRNSKDGGDKAGGAANRGFRASGHSERLLLFAPLRGRRL